ncbi:SUR7/PalI family-domain-containing protein [Xylariaceae sp. FL0804]|nr:SUR7/PalI family-domain-containing protein [Xylariaceae sp. FL0804]
MVNVGRYACVALPFILTLVAIICGLIAGLTGVTSNDLYLFRIDLSNLSVDATQLGDIIGNVSDLFSRSAEPNEWPEWHDSTLDDIAAEASTEKASAVSDITGIAGSAVSDSDVRIYAANLSLANVYDVNMWGYCTTLQSGHRNCTKAEFNWAEKSSTLNLTWVTDLAENLGLNITIPSELNDGLKAYKEVNKWTEVVYIISMIALGLELVVGFFTACSRAISCLTWIISGFATVAVIASAVLMTVMGSVVVGAVSAAAHEYGVTSRLDSGFLATIWIGVAAALGASLFWLFSACCCKPEHRPYAKHSRGASESEKFLSGSYAPIGDRNSGYAQNNAYGYQQQQQRGGARSDLAYEPYSQRV